MNVTLPDGTIVNDVPDDITKDALTAKLSANGYDVSKLKAPAPAPAPEPANPALTLAPVDSSAIYRSAGNLAKDIGGGLLEGTGKIAAKYGMALPNAIRDISMRQMPGTTSDQLASSAAGVGPKVADDPTSIAYRGASAAPEMAATTAALGVGSTALAGALPRAMGATRPLIADVALNSGYEGAKAGSEGKGITDIVAAMGQGGMGAGLGHFAGGLAQRGVSPMLGQSAQTLIANDITPSYGQMGGRIGTAVENVGGYLPVVGPAIERAKGGAMRQYSRAEVNQATAPINFKTNAVGEDAVNEANDAINASYNRVVDQTHMPAIDAQKAIVKTQTEMGTMPLLSEPQINQIQKYIDDKIQPELSFSQRTNNQVPGRTAKNIDTELGAYARKYQGSTNPADHELGDAFAKLQANLRDALDSSNTEALAQLKASNTAFRNMLPVSGAARKAMVQPGKLGEFTPTQMLTAADSADVDLGRRGLNRAARELLTSGGSGLKTTGQVLGGLSAGAADPLLTGLGMAAAHTIYSQPVRSMIARGVLPRALMDKLPFTAAQLGARIGADNANQ